MKSWVLITAIVTLVVLFLFTIIGGFFNGWSFFAIIFYLALYGGGYAYVRIGAENRANDGDRSLQRRQKFEYCWERINQILKSMPGGQGIEWASGFGRKSGIKSYFDGVQSKPFRSVLAYLEYSQQLVLIIYDIEGDDIAEFIANPSPELMDNPFYNFKPYTRGVDSNAHLDRFGGYAGSSRYPWTRRNPRGRYPPPSEGGVSINVDGGGGGIAGKGEYADLEGGGKVNPPKDLVDNAVNKLKK